MAKRIFCEGESLVRGEEVVYEHRACLSRSGKEKELFKVMGLVIYSGQVEWLVDIRFGCLKFLTFRRLGWVHWTHWTAADRVYIAPRAVRVYEKMRQDVP